MPFQGIPERPGHWGHLANTKTGPSVLSLR